MPEGPSCVLKYPHGSPALTWESFHPALPSDGAEFHWVKLTFVLMGAWGISEEQRQLGKAFESKVAWGGVGL